MSKKPLTRPAPAEKRRRRSTLSPGRGLVFQFAPGVQPGMWDALRPKGEGQFSNSFQSRYQSLSTTAGDTLKAQPKGIALPASVTAKDKVRQSGSITG